MTLEEFYELNTSGTRVMIGKHELHVNQHTDCNKYTVVRFEAICDDLMKVWVTK